MTKDIESEIQDWIAKESEQSYRFASDALVIGADELAEFVTEVFKKLEGCVVVPANPTNSMCHAGKEIDGRLSAFKCADIYKAMLEAARGGNE